MKNTYPTIVISTILYLLLIGISLPTYAQEHPKGKEHPGRSEFPDVEPPNRKPVPAREVTPDEIRESIRIQIDQTLKKNNNLFPIKDEKTKQSLKLGFIKVHDDKVSIIQAKGAHDTDTYFACTDFIDPTTGTAYDLDFWMKLQPNGKLKVTKTRIHKVDGQPRYTYEGDKIVDIPVKKN